MKAYLVAVAALLAVATPIYAQTMSRPMTAQTTSSGLQYTDTKVGTGVSPRCGQTATVHYTGWLYNDGIMDVN